MAWDEGYSWARYALQDIDEGRARGNRLALRLRAFIQSLLFKWGCFTQRHFGKVLVFGFLIFFIFVYGLSRARIETDAEKLWVEVGGRLSKEINYSELMLGKEFGLTQEVVIQTPNFRGTNMLSIESMMLHKKALIKAAGIKVKVEGREWSLKDICYKPNLPAFDDKLLHQIMGHLMPCTFITPMDCFWEGAKIHGPEVDISLPNDPDNSYLKWTSLNPIGLLNQISKMFFLYPWEMQKIRTMFDEAGITTGYLEKPCLDPKDPQCPLLAPNFRSKEVPDVGAVLTGGCNGFAAKYMEWPEELIVGGLTKNRSGTIRSASALQSTILLMGAPNLREYYQDEDWAKGEYISWNIDTARKILTAWQTEFTKAMKEITNLKKDEFKILAFASAAFNELLRDFSKTSTFSLAMGYVLMLIYSGLTLKRWNDTVKSFSGLGVAGVLLVTVAVASGLGFSAFIGIDFNAASTQVLPFLALGLGVDDMFLLAHTYASISDRGEVHPSELVGYALGNTGVSVFLTSFINMFGFLMAGIIPIPALRSFSFQAAVIVLFNYLAVTIVYPAMLAIDVKRRQDQRFDLCFCFQRNRPQRILITPNSSTDSDLVLRRYNNSSSSLSSESSVAVHASASAVVLSGGVQAAATGTVSLPGAVTLTAPSAVAEISTGAMLPLSVSALTTTEDVVTLNTLNTNTRNGCNMFDKNSNHSKTYDAENSSRLTNTMVSTGRRQVAQSNRRIETTQQETFMGSHYMSSRSTSRNSTSKWFIVRNKLKNYSLTNFAKFIYGPLLQKFPAKIFVLFVFAALFGVSIYGCLKVQDGLDLTDVVPRNSTEHDFVTAQMKYFSIYPMYLVTMKDFDYPNQQKLLYKYHEAFKSVNSVVKTPEMHLRPFWLMYFRNWLQDIQKAFDRDWALGTINYTGWKENASDSGILGYKMLAQTGNEDNDIDRKQVRSVRLVDKEGIINPKAFYNYLTVWYNVDPMGFTSSQGNIRPKPGNWVNSRDAKEYHNVRVQAAKPIEFAQIMFYLVNLKDTDTHVKVIKEVREICEEFKTRGLPSYPSGIPFTFWEQYIWLRPNLLMAIAIILSACFLVMFIILCNAWAGIIIVAILTMITVQVFGFMGLAGIKLSAVPAVTLILSVGVGVEFTVHMCLAFQMAIGDRNTRMQQAVEQVFSPITDGTVSTLLGVIMLAGSNFDFIVRYFFHMLCALMVIGFTNGLVFLPVLLSLAGPSPEVEVNRPPGTASSAGSQRELIQVPSCRRGPTPTESQLCILSSSTNDSKIDEHSENSRRHRKHDSQLCITDNSTHDDRTESRRKHRKKQRSENRRVHAAKTPNMVQYDMESSSSVVRQITATATATVTFQVKTNQLPNERTVTERTANGGSYCTDQGGVTIVDLEDHDEIK